MADINIFIIEGPGEARKRLKKLLPPQVRKSLDQAGLEVDMESHEELRDKLPAGFPRKFTVPEEVLVFPSTKENLNLKEGRKKLRDLRNSAARKKIPGNGE